MLERFVLATCHFKEYKQEPNARVFTMYFVLSMFGLYNRLEEKEGRDHRPFIRYYAASTDLLSVVEITASRKGIIFQPRVRHFL